MTYATVVPFRLSSSLGRSPIPSPQARLALLSKCSSFHFLRILRMPSRHSQDASSRMLPPLPNVPPGTSVLRGLAILTAVGLFIVWYWLLLYCLVASMLPHFPQFWFNRLRRAVFSNYYLYIHFSAALVLSCSLGRKCSCIWQVLEVGFPGFSHFGKKVQRDAHLVDLEKIINAEKWIFTCKDRRR